MRSPTRCLALESVFLLLPYVAVKERAEGISKPMIIASTTPLNRVELWVLAQKRLGLRGQFRVS